MPAGRKTAKPLATGRLDGLVFGVPKSFSIYLAIAGDEVVESITRSAVDKTMRAMESDMQCKVRKGWL
jgi:hypothetical protein